MNKLNIDLLTSSSFSYDEDYYTYTSFINECVMETTLNQKEFKQCYFKNCDFVDMTFDHCYFISCVFENCDLSNITFDSTLLRDTLFINCKMMGTSFHECLIEVSTFKESHMALASLSLNNIKNSEFIALTLTRLF